MEKQSFRKYGVSTYASQILQRYRRYTSCKYEFQQGKYENVLKVSDGRDKFTLKDKSWNGIAYQLSELMREPKFEKLVREKDRERMVFNEPNNNSFRPTYPSF